MEPVHSRGCQSIPKEAQSSEGNAGGIFLEDGNEKSSHSSNMLNVGMQEYGIKEMKAAARGRNGGLGDKFVHPEAIMLVWWGAQSDWEHPNSRFASCEWCSSADGSGSPGLSLSISTEGRAAEPGAPTVPWDMKWGKWETLKEGEEFLVGLGGPGRECSMNGGRTSTSMEPGEQLGSGWICGWEVEQG